MLEDLRLHLLYGKARPTTEYDEEPVEYCADCHSLCIKSYDGVSDGWDGAYCGKCGSTDIRQCSIQEWLAEEDRRRVKK